MPNWFWVTFCLPFTAGCVGGLGLCLGLVDGHPIYGSALMVLSMIQLGHCLRGVR